jgi:hypothetical protein
MPLRCGVPPPRELLGRRRPERRRVLVAVDLARPLPLLDRRLKRRLGTIEDPPDQVCRALLDSEGRGGGIHRQAPAPIRVGDRGIGDQPQRRMQALLHRTGFVEQLAHGFGLALDIAL